MKSNTVAIGYDNYLEKGKFVAVLDVKSSPIRKIIKIAEQEGKLVDVTAGRKRKSLVITNSEYMFISAKTPSSILKSLE